jgi:hypothetical protein
LNHCPEIALKSGALQVSIGLYPQTPIAGKLNMKKILLFLAVMSLYVLHQDIWFWRTARPFVLGFIPIGLFYHACFSAAAALVLSLLVKHAWPSHLEEETEREPSVEK